MARKTKGRLYKSGKKGAYHLQYYVDGKEFKVILKDESGNIITTERKARLAADALLHPVFARNKADQLRQILEAVENAEAKAIKLEEEQKSRMEAELEKKKDAKATLISGWTMFMESPKRPASCKRYGSDFPRHSTPGNYKGYYDSFVKWMTASHPEENILSAITHNSAEAFMDYIAESSAPGTFNKYLQFFNLFFKVLNEDGKIQCGNPFSNIDRMENHYHSKKPLTVEQIAHLIDSSQGEMRILIALGYFTGLRFGDCCTLLWSEVDLLRGIIERIPRKTEHTVKDYQQAVVKVGIPAYLSVLLSEIPESDRRGYILPEFAQEYTQGKEYKANRRLLDHFEKCGIRIIKEGTGTHEVKDAKGNVITKAVRAVVECGFHSLRYSYISHNAEAGTPASVIQKNAGHANPAMTEHYTRISDRAAVEYANLLQLPSSDCQIIDVEPIGAEPERKELHRLADTLSIEQIKAILANIPER